MLTKIFHNKILKETVWSFAAQGSAAVFFFGLTIVLARTLGIEKFGSWSFFLSLFTIISLLSYFGINFSAKTFVAKHIGTEHIRGVLRDATKMRVYFSLIFSILLLIFAKSLAYLVGRPDFFKLFLLASPLTFFSGMVQYLKNIFIGLRRMKYNFVINVLEYGLKLSIVVVYFLFSTEIFAVVTSYLLALGITALVGFILLYFNFYRQMSIATTDFRRSIFKYSVPLFFISFGSIVAMEMDTVMVGLLSSRAEVGIYSVAKQIVLKLPHITLAISMVAMPIFAKLDHENRERLKKLLYRLLKINTLIFGSISAVILFFARYFIPLIFGIEYIRSALVLQLLIPYLLIFTYTNFISSFLDYRGLAKKRAINFSIALLINLALNILLIPQYGAVGAAIATSVSYIPYIWLNWVEVKKELNSD
jgi:O-antigen/teichoic acid export membrane protein